MEQNIQALIDQAEELEDQSVEETSSFTDEPIAKGLTVGRFVEYIELGKHKQPDYQGKAKPDAEMIRVTFELLHPTKNIREFEVDGKKVKAGQLISIMMPKKLNEKAKFKKLYNKMTYGREIKHMAKMLGEAFVIEIFHNVVKKDGKDVTYANLYNEHGEFGIGAPFKVDPMTEEKQTYDVPAATRALKIFLWNNPTKDTWDSLFIDGSHERKKEDGSVEQVSKNWLQERIMSATNFNGSPLNIMLGGVDDLPMNEGQAKSEEPPFETDDTPEEKPADEPKQEKGAKTQASTSTASDDALAALGLVA